VRVSRQAGDQHTLMNWLINLGTADLMAGDLNEAKSVLVDGLQVAQEIDDRTAMSCLVEALACHAVATDHEKLAARSCWARRRRCKARQAR